MRALEYRKDRIEDLTAGDEEELWRKYQKTRDTRIRDKLVEQYSPLVKYVAGKVSANLPASVEYDDLVGYGIFGLFDAIEKYDPDKNVKFKTYAVTRIRGAIYDHLREMDWVPRSIRQKAKDVEEAVMVLESKLGRPATDTEIAAALGLSEQDFSHLMSKISSTAILSLNDIWNAGNDNEKTSIGETIESPRGLNPDSSVEREEIRRVIVQAINELPEKEKKVLVLYYYEDLTLREIGQILEVTESRISQLHTKAIIRLKAKLTSYRKGIF
ncbi:MAG TPA: RNA polymerase sigma factor WhiG [Spirochaetales bacterium]|nr:RNA polymerase sigma factor WhiG [Spirochaetales bacterium]HPS14305.1 RNA polymerase sigma factor WhiG [Spirochaetales bacterium]